jgi:chromosome segregation ATPase
MRSYNDVESYRIMIQKNIESLKFIIDECTDESLKNKLEDQITDLMENLDSLEISVDEMNDEFEELERDKEDLEYSIKDKKEEINELKYKLQNHDLNVDFSLELLKDVQKKYSYQNLVDIFPELAGAAYQDKADKKKIGQELLKIVEDFIEEQMISCPEAIHQSDRVIENAYQFIEDLCNKVGYCDHECGEE